MKIKHFHHFIQAPSEEGADGSSAASVDRGDSLEPAVPAVPVVDAAAEAEEKEAVGKTDEAEAQDAKVDDEAPKTDEKVVDKQKLTIPKAVFDARNAKHRQERDALANRVAELEAQTKREAQAVDVQTTNAEIETLEAEYQKALDDGKSESAMKIMRDIRMKERQIAAAQIQHTSERARVLAIEQFKLDSIIDKLEADFPILNPEHEDYAQETVDEVMLLRSGFEKNGMASSAAIAKAVKYVLGEKKVVEAEAEDKPEDAPKGLKANDKKSEQVRKNIDAAKSQPAKLDAVGLDANKKGGGEGDISSYTEAEFAALPESTKARMRGDFIENGMAA